MDTNRKALDSIFNDLDDMETQKMFPPEEPKGVSITISVTPNGEVSEPEMSSESETPEMSMGGKVEGYSEGGAVEVPKENPDEDLKSLPPFLRKKRRS